MQNFDKILTASESKVAEFIRRQPEDVVNNSIKDVAALAGVSVASASRLAITLGYRDWKEMRHNLVRDLTDTPETVFSDITREDSGEAVIKKIFDCSILSLRDTFGQMDAGDIQKTVAAIKKTDRVVFFGTGRSGCFAMEESLRFACLDISAEAYSDEYQMILQASRIKREQVCFGFSNSGRSRATVGALATARRNRAITIGIANYKETPLEKVSDIYFCTSFPRVGEISSSLTARIALLCVMDAIYVLFTRQIDSSSNVMLTDRLINKNLRLPARGGDIKVF
jgi:DNA-binding MurR/RpiR family transcriptional regulator